MGNVIVDPCFAPPSTEGVVVCAANPATGDPGFALRLTKPLPGDVVTPSSTAEPWLLRLADGQVCTPFTGTVPEVGTEEARWSCADASSPGSAGLVTTIDRGTTWTVQWYPAAEGHSPAHPSPPTVPARRIPVADVWE